MVSRLLKLLFDGLAPGLGQAWFGEGVLVGGTGFGLTVGGGEQVALDSVGGGAPAAGLLGDVNTGEGFQGFVVLALAGEDEGGLLDGAKFLSAADATFAFEVQTIGGEGAGIVLEVGFAVVAEVDEDAGQQSLVGGQREGALQVGFGGLAVLGLDVRLCACEGGGANMLEGPLGEILLAVLL